MLARRTRHHMEEENDLIGKQIGNYRLIEEIASGSLWYGLPSASLYPNQSHRGP